MIAALQRPSAPALPAAAAAHPGRTAQHLLTFTLLVVGGALLLLRFGIPAGAKSVSLVGPVGMAAAALGLLRGELQFSRVRLVLFLALAFCTACGLALHASLPSSFGVPPSTQSLLQFLALSSFATLSFARPVRNGASSAWSPHFSHSSPRRGCCNSPRNSRGSGCSPSGSCFPKGCCSRKATTR